MWKFSVSTLLHHHHHPSGPEAQPARPEDEVDYKAYFFLPSCSPARLHAYLSCLPTCLPASPPAYPPASLLACLQGPTKFFAAYKQISLIGSVPTKFTINSTTNWGLCLQAALACLPTLSGPGCRAFKRA